jgi:hypothetical protein
MSSTYILWVLLAAVVLFMVLKGGSG